MRSLVFSGEGAKGGFQAAIALQRAQQPDLVIGTSSGAVNAVGYAYLGPQGLVNLWKTINSTSQVFRLSVLDALVGNGLYSSAPINKILQDVIYDNKPSCEVIVTRASDETGALEYVSNRAVGTDEFYEAVCDAIAIPAVVDHPDGFVDGVVGTDLPLSYAIQCGATDLTAIIGTPPIPYAVTSKAWPVFDFISRGYRFVDLLLNQVMFGDLAVCTLRQQINPSITLRVYGPRGYLFEPLDFASTVHGVEMAMSGQYGEWIYSSKGWQFSGTLGGYPF
jgi:predicted acylesterase/phospholipase RssA